ncbi:TVP38/TMEM64 family protein [Endozoicomonas acroporae]|uniref:TVP38/TMEM64 family protein n=1 Tax=Endozoicomonas acroporae TaxID=1701104 RepID=UPI000C77C829|nr:TVP38/TMEM64 family protein [Endozoicomonas acroporae]
MTIQSITKPLIVLLITAAILAIPPAREWLFEMIRILSSLDIDKVRTYILSFGLWAPLVSGLLMVIQAVAAPLPAFILTFANAAIFGWWQGALLSWSSAMIAATLCFFISRWFGREGVARLTSHFALDQVDDFFAKHGQYTILIARLLPFISFDLVSYGAGLTSMKLRYFLVATGIGQLPATLIYSYVGEMLTGGSRLAVMALLTLFAISVLIFFLKSVYFRESRPVGNE